MALEKCRECGSEVSNSAKVCPACGIRNPVKKTSFLVKALITVSVIGVVASVAVGPTESTPTVAKLTPKQEAISLLKIDKLEWHKGGFDSVMLASFKIKNNGARDVKDITLECLHRSNSGTVIDQNTKQIYELVKAGKSISMKEFNMGFIHKQANSTSCTITDLVLP